MPQVDLFSSPTHPPVSHCDCCRIAKFIPNLIAVRQWTQCGIVYSSYSYRFAALLQQIFFKFLAFLYTPVLHQQQIVYTGYAASALSKIIYTFSAMAALSSTFLSHRRFSSHILTWLLFSTLAIHFLYCRRFSIHFLH